MIVQAFNHLMSVWVDFWNGFSNQAFNFFHKGPKRSINSFRYNEFRGSRGGPWWLTLIVGASSLHNALNTRDPEWIELAEKLSEHVYSDGGICLHPDAKNRKYLHKFLKNFDPEEEIIAWHDGINNTITKHPYAKRNPLRTAELLS